MTYILNGKLILYITIMICFDL